MASLMKPLIAGFGGGIGLAWQLEAVRQCPFSVCTLPEFDELDSGPLIGKQLLA